MISLEEYKKSLIKTLLRSGADDLPKNNLDRHVLLKSALCLIGAPGPFTEKEINAQLQRWVLAVNNLAWVDFVVLRRALVDEGYLARSADGAKYELLTNDPRQLPFAAEVCELDLASFLEQTRQSMEQKKQAYLKKNSP